MELKLVNIVDMLAPIEISHTKHLVNANEKTTRLINKKRKHLQNWKRHGRVNDKINANKLNKEIIGWTKA